MWHLLPKNGRIHLFMDCLWKVEQRPVNVKAKYRKAETPTIIHLWGKYPRVLGSVGKQYCKRWTTHTSISEETSLLFDEAHRLERAARRKKNERRQGALQQEGWQPLLKVGVEACTAHEKSQYSQLITAVGLFLHELKSINNYAGPPEYCDKTVANAQVACA